MKKLLIGALAIAALIGLGVFALSNRATLVKAWDEGVEAVVDCLGWEVTANPETRNEDKVKRGNTYYDFRWVPTNITGTGSGSWGNETFYDYEVEVTWKKQYRDDWGDWTDVPFWWPGDETYKESSNGTVYKPQDCVGVCTDPQAQEYTPVEELTGEQEPNNSLCVYDELPYCVEDETVYVPVNQDPPEGAVEGACKVPEEPEDPEEPRTPSSFSTPSAPVCPNGETILVPQNFHVFRNGSTAELRWVPTEGDQVNIYFRENDQAGWQHAKADQPNNGVNEITELNPALGYTFGLQQKNGCGGGELVTAVVIDPPAYGELFPFSYWMW